MHSYSGLRAKHGSQVSQTLDAPILIFDFWELGDAFVGIAVIMIFGVVLYEWMLMIAFLTIVLVAASLIRNQNEKGVFLHWPYKAWGISLPGLFNPKGTRRFSD